MKAVILARVSKSTQDYERQVAELGNVAALREYETIEEIVSTNYIVLILQILYFYTITLS